MAKRTRAQAISVPVRRRGRLGLTERFPVRRVILTVLSIVIILLVTVGTYKTLTLPAGHGRLSAGVWRDLVVQYRVHGKPAHDARIVAAMRLHGVARILTFNGRDFARYAGIIVIHPQNCATSQES